MFSDSTPFSSFSVDDVPAARAFYGDTLGLKVSEEGPLLTLSLPHDQAIMVYAKEDHEPAGFTVLNFPVSDVDRAVADLAELGIEVVRYPDRDQDEKGIVREDGPPTAWFKDPAGNVLSVMEVIEHEA